jgi:hypothetical protein
VPLLGDFLWVGLRAGDGFLFGHRWVPCE